MRSYLLTLRQSAERKGRPAHVLVNNNDYSCPMSTTSPPTQLQTHRNALQLVREVTELLAVRFAC
jgi:hypothetical protein